MRRRGASVDRGEPRAHRRGDDARRHRRRVPRLQREQRPAVRADLRPQGRGAQRGEPRAAATRCASAARASASSTTSRPRRTRDGTHGRGAEPEARDRRRSRCRDDSTILVRPRSALGLKYVEITKGDVARRASRTAPPIPLGARHAARRSRSTRFLRTFDEPTRAALAHEPQRVRRRARRRAAQSLNEALGVFPSAAARTSRPVMENLADPRTDLRGFVRGLGQAAAEAAPVAEEQAALFRNLDTTFARARRRARRSSRRRSTTGPPALDAGDPTASRSSGRSCATASCSFRELRPGVRALRNAAPDLARRLREGRRCCAARSQLNSASSRRSARCRRSPRTR